MKRSSERLAWVVGTLMAALGATVAACSLVIDTTGLAGPGDGGARASDGSVILDSGGNSTDTGAPDSGPVPAVPARSCTLAGPGLNDCGPFGDENCCTRPLVIGGETFFQSYDGNTFLFKTHRATLKSFGLDRFEVTVGRFRAFVSASANGWSPAPRSGKHTHLNAGQGLALRTAGAFEPGWDGAWTALHLATSQAGWTANLSDAACANPNWTQGAGENEAHPINCVTWFEAYAFCIWDGGFLPSFAEWNDAAAGGAEQRVYPWSNPHNDTTIDCMNANYGGEQNPPTGCVDAGSPTARQTAPVGTHSPKGDGRWGHTDLAGNVAEWNFDQYDTLLDDCHDCALTSEEGLPRVVHGGDFSSRNSYVYASSNTSQSAVTRSEKIGFRCARTP